MKRMFSTLALLALVSMSVGVKPAQAQSFFIGEYQKKIVKGAISGATAGAEAAGVPGAVVGTGFGFGYADYQHNSGKVHNYRTRVVGWQSFDYGFGFFGKNGGIWQEFQNGRHLVNFYEVARTASYIDLYDPGRQMTIRLQANSVFWKQPHTGWNFIYNGRAR